ncbi:Glycine-rich domain-containing protein 1 [Cardamine amara subsp. amara]|uniref:Glycine-rich domain-containing protein 1 n=1 Tax=Cardamine amara subsp. amara TaxID=228776 RepID=A0ABD1C7K3_CARAN
MSLGQPEFADGVAARSLSEISEVDAVRIGADIVSAARRLIALLRSVGDCQWLHHPPVIAEAIRRYDELWMPLISDLTVGLKPPMILPPLDIEWVWFCHSLNPVSYRDYCQKRFSKLIGKPAIYDEENEDYAVLQCEKIWVLRYPLESFENRADPDSSEFVSLANEDIKTQVEKLSFLWEKFSAPYMSETVYLIAARLRYKGFLLILHKFKDEISRLIPASDILLMWLTHQSYPTIYSEDVDEMLEEMTRKVVRVGEKTEVETTKELWDRYFNQPYEKAGGVLANESCLSNKTMFYWPVSDMDVNTAYKSIRPRFVLELCIFVRLNSKAEVNESSFLRLRVARCHRKLQLDKKLTDLSSRDASWKKGWHLYCEFGTLGVVLESHCDRRGHGTCFRSGKAERMMIEFPWNDLLRAHSLASGRFLGKQVGVFASVTPPVQAPYLLRFVPDRVTDDSGAMVSDSIQRTNNFRPQEGRWLTRTVLDHVGRECFVIRIRVGKGVFKRGGEVPSPVKSEERITEIRVGSWSYVEGSIGKAPANVVGTVMPKEPVEDWEAAWEFSTGDELSIRWDSSGSISELGLHSRNPGSMVRLLTGRKMQYKGEDEEDDEGFVTVVRSTEEDPTEKATALIDWKHQAVEFLPEEDAVFILLLSVSILRSVTHKRREDVGKLLVRKRITEATGERDWGSVIVDASSSNVSSFSSPYVEPWYRNSGKVMAMEEKAQVARYPYPVMSYSNVDGGDNLYKHVIFG